MAELGRAGLHLLLMSVVIGGLWLYADAHRRASAKPVGTWKDATGVSHTGNPYARLEPPFMVDIVATADPYDDGTP